MHNEPVGVANAEEKSSSGADPASPDLSHQITAVCLVDKDKMDGPQAGSVKGLGLPPPQNFTRRRASITMSCSNLMEHVARESAPPTTSGPLTGPAARKAMFQRMGNSMPDLRSIRAAYNRGIGLDGMESLMTSKDDSTTNEAARKARTKAFELFEDVL